MFKSGCTFNKTCMEVNSTWADGCRTRKCVVHRDGKMIQRSIAPISAGKISNKTIKFNRMLHMYMMPLVLSSTASLPVECEQSIAVILRKVLFHSSKSSLSVNRCWFKYIYTKNIIFIKRLMYRHLWQISPIVFDLWYWFYRASAVLKYIKM